MINSSKQTWNSDNYANNARFVSDLGAPVLDLLAPKPGERILDIVPSDIHECVPLYIGSREDVKTAEIFLKD